MRISVVVATHNQQERTRLVLRGLSRQGLSPLFFEVVVVDDGSTDGTACMLKDVAREMPLQVIRLTRNQGRSRARNVGVQRARGDLIAFLDGDALPDSSWLERLAEAYDQQGTDCFLCGFERNLPDLEYMQDPQRATPVPGVTPSVTRRFLQQHRDEMVVTEEMIDRDFGEIHRHSQEGGYPFPELKSVQEQTVDLFCRCPDSPIAWIGFYPHNGLIPRSTFMQVGGFDNDIPFSEGWDLGYRLRQAGCRPHFVADAVTYHLYHHHGFSEPTQIAVEAVRRRRALQHMMSRYDDARLVLLDFWRAAIWPDPFIPAEMVVGDLVECDRLYRGLSDAEIAEYQAVAKAHPVWRTWEEAVPR